MHHLKKVTLKLNVDLKELPKGSVFDLSVDRDGVIVDRYWRKRVQDSKIDNCVSVIEIQPKRLSKEKSTNKREE